MPLSAEEQRRLAELEESLNADDPAFTRSFSGPGTPRPRKRPRRQGSTGRMVGAGAGVVVGLGLLVAGVEWNPVISVLGFLVMLVSVVLALGLLPGRGARGPRVSTNGGRSGHRTRAQARNTAPDEPKESFTTRMERRWQRRTRGEL